MGEPACALSDGQGNKYCVLECQEDSQCDVARGATCALVQPPLGVCLYGAGPMPTPKPSPKPTPPAPLPTPVPKPTPTPAPTPGHEGDCLSLTHRKSVNRQQSKVCSASGAPILTCVLTRMRS